MCQTKIATFEHYFQLLSNLKIIIIQRRRNIRIFLNFYSRFNHFSANLPYACLSNHSVCSPARPHTHPTYCPYIRSIYCTHARHSRFSAFLLSAYLINTRAPRVARVHISPASSRVIRTFIAMFSYGRRKQHGRFAVQLLKNPEPSSGFSLF